METGADKMATPQLGSPALTVCFSALLAVSTAIAAGLYCLAVQALSELGLGAASYTAALLLPILIGVGAALAAIGPANRRFRKLRQAFQTIIDGDLSVRLPEKNTGIFIEEINDSILEKNVSPLDLLYVICDIEQTYGVSAQYIIDNTTPDSFTIEHITKIIFEKRNVVINA